MATSPTPTFLMSRGLGCSPARGSPQLGSSGEERFPRPLVVLERPSRWGRAGRSPTPWTWAQSLVGGEAGEEETQTDDEVAPSPALAHPVCPGSVQEASMTTASQPSVFPSLIIYPVNICARPWSHEEE